MLLGQCILLRSAKLNSTFVPIRTCWNNATALLNNIHITFRWQHDPVVALYNNGCKLPIISMVSQSVDSSVLTHSWASEEDITLCSVVLKCTVKARWHFFGTIIITCVSIFEDRLHHCYFPNFRMHARIYVCMHTVLLMSLMSSNTQKSFFATIPCLYFLGEGIWIWCIWFMMWSSDFILWAW